MLFSSVADAQSDEELSRARGWFAQGIEMSEAGDYGGAADSFRRVLAIRDSPAVRYNLALNLYEMSLLREADEHVQVVLDNPETPPEIRSDATDLRLHIEETGGRLSVQISGAAVGTFVVQLDGRVVPNNELGTNMRVRAGDHVVNVTRGGEELASEFIQVERGTARRVSIQLALSPADVAEAAERPPSESDAIVAEDVAEEGPQRESHVWKVLVVVGAVVAAGGIAALTYALARGETTYAAPYMGNTEPGVLVFD